MENKHKKKVVQALKKASDENMFRNNIQLARWLGINPAQLSTILGGQTEKVIKDAKWIEIATKLNVVFENDVKWTAASTPTYEYIYNALKNCQEMGVSRLLCDQAGIGKSFTAKRYVAENRNAVYIDCSQAKTKMRFIRRIAREFGLDQNGNYPDVYDSLVNYLQFGVNKPLIILDEAGDLEASAFLELKALWNASEFKCGWFMMGADGLKAKIELNLRNQKVGYTELFDRYGKKYLKIIPAGKQESESFKKHQFMLIAKANGVNDPGAAFARCDGSIRRLFTEVQKQQQTENNG